MKILVVKPHLPVPPTQGTRRVTLGLLEDLATKADVSFLSMLERPEERELLPVIEALGVRVRAPLMPNRRSLVHRVVHRAVNDLSSFASGYPRSYYYGAPPVLAEALSRWTGEERFDVVVLEYWTLARLLPSVRSGTPVILAHDAEFVVRERRRALLAREGGSAVARWRLGRERDREIETLSSCAEILALTERDRTDLLGALGPGGRSRVHVLPVRAGVSAPADPPAPEEETVGFLGSFKADFNVDAFEHFTADVWPRVRAARPHARLLVAGGDLPERFASRGSNAGVELLGYVTDLEAFLATTRVFVVPLRFGGGLRIRLIEALTVGSAVVSTGVGVAGLDLVPGRHFVRADAPGEMSEAIVSLLGDEARRRTLVVNGRAFAAERFAPDAARRRTIELFETIAGRSAA